jgi:AmmeMemoRadiSam system protein B
MSTDLGKRERYLPAGWYPDDAAEIRSLVSDWTKLQKDLSAFAIMAPHAGWYFSGDLAAKAVWALRDCDTVAILGGHLRRGDPILFAGEGCFDCTVREGANDLQILNALKSELKDAGIKEIAPDQDVDNSVEIMLPLAALRFPQAGLVWLRVPPDYKARELGSALARAASTCGKKLSVIASTDLTHYGPSYGFMPHGVGESAVDWVRDENDRGFIAAALSMDTDRVLAHARDRFSACSSGAVAAAISFSFNSGAKRGVLIGHKLSYDVHPDRSFVGYAAIAFVP